MPLSPLPRPSRRLEIPGFRLGHGSDRTGMTGVTTEEILKQVHPDAKEAWDVEVLRRLQEIDSGAVEMIPWSEVRKRLFRDLGGPGVRLGETRR